MMNIKKRQWFYIAAILVAIVAVFLTVHFYTVAKSAAVEAAKVREALIIEQLSLSDRLVKSYDYDAALDILSQIEEVNDSRLLDRIEEIKGLKGALVKYEGEVPHVFFHSLIVYPELAFDGDYKEEGYDLWMTTVYEFKLMMQSMYERGYVLFDIRDMIEEDENGNIRKKEIWMPPGKTPFVLSIDDVCYYDYMANDGFASRLVLDENGDVATVVPDLEGVEHITRDGDVMPIIDELVAENPDFSYKGAKGIIAVTGYEGILGYRITDVEGEEYDKMMADLKPVVDRLKETGWSFASHSYTHNDYFKTGKITLDEMKSDCDRWKQLIEPATGETNIYISPFGVKYEQDDPRYRYLLEHSSFKIYCPVGGTIPTKYYDDNMIMGRYALDGLSLKRNKNLLSKFFDCDEIIDPRRPK